jgi:hypothetical protein
MANKRLIDANALWLVFGEEAEKIEMGVKDHRKLVTSKLVMHWCMEQLAKAPKVDAVEVVRCQNCVHAEPLDHNCELSTSYYMHCKLWRGEETKNVWHKYKKYYKDYSLVERDGYCDAGAKMDGGNKDV